MRDLLLCIAAALAVVIGILFLGSLPGITHAWYSLIFFTAILVAAISKMYWKHRGKARVWPLLGAFIAAHIAAYVMLLHYVPDWPAFLYILTGPAEIVLFILIAKSRLHVLPTTTKL